MRQGGHLGFNPGSARRAACPAAEAPRGHGGAHRRSGAARQDRQADRGQHGRGGLLGLCAARRQRAGALRHGRPEGGLRAPRHADRRARPGRPHRRGGAAAQPARTRRRIPAFAYLPETGEEIYHSFLGVPVLRAGRTLGVLVVQNRSHRTYTEEEVEALQTTAMVLAEMFASGEMEDISMPGADLDVNRPVHLKGAPLRRRHRARPRGAARAARRRDPAHRRGRRRTS